MLRADSSEVNWDADKKRWTVRVKVGEEVMRRPLLNTPRNAAEEVLRSLAVETAKADGYDLDPANVAIVH